METEQSIWETAFANGFWVFVGIVAGSLIQFGFNWLLQGRNKKNAILVLETEIRLNLEVINGLKQRIDSLRMRISSGQINENDLFVPMQEFDYSALSPLVQSGYFHMMLGPEKIRDYFEFMRFFNNRNSEFINSMLRSDHEAGKSIDNLDRLEACTIELEKKLYAILN